MSKKKEKYQHNFVKTEKQVTRLNNEKQLLEQKQQELVQEIQRLEMMAQTQEMNVDFPQDYADNDLADLDEMREDSYDDEYDEEKKQDDDDGNAADN